MKKWAKIVSVAAAVLIALIIALIVLANVLITPERIKQTLLPLAEEKLHRKIDLGNIEVSLFSGIEIHGLTIYEQDDSEIFLSTDLVRLRYQLLPLLAMKVVVDEVRLEKPSIRVVRFDDGQFNFSDLMDFNENEVSQAESAANQKPEQTQDSVPISLLVSNVLIQDGQLVFFDHVLNNKAPYRYQVSSLQFAAKGVSLSGKVPLSMQCQLNGSQLTLDGHMNLQPLGGEFKIELQGLDAVAFRPYLQDILPGKLGALKLDINSTVSGTPEEISLKGALSLKELDVVFDAMPDTPLKNARLDATYDLVFSYDQEKLQLQQLTLDYNGIKLNTSGVANSLMSNPVLDLSIAVPKLQIRQAIAAAPAGLVGDVGSLDPAGSLSIEATLSGRIDNAMQLLKSATLDLESVQATVGGQRPAFSGRMLVSGDQLTSEKLHVRLGDNRADITLKASRLFADPIVVKADISSQRFQLEPLLAGSAGAAVASDQSKTDVKVAQSSKQPGPFDIPLHATGTIAVAETLWKGLAVQNFLTQYELKDNILNISRMDGQVAGGTFGNSARVDLGKEGLSYSAQLGLKSIQADPLLTAFAPKAAGSLLGAMDLTFALDGRGTEWQALSRNLSGDGNLLIVDGRLISPGLVNGLSEVLQLPELNDIPFDDFKGQFKVADGKVRLDSQLLSKRLKLFPEGNIGLDGSLNMGLDTRLSPELSARLDKKGGVLSYLADKDGWTRIPLLLKGSFSSPKFGLDPKGVKEQATKALTDELGQQIDKLFKRSAPASQGSDQQPAENQTAPAEDPSRKLLQDSLQKLFGN
ncbi:MAG: AsmA family protein [Desulfuromonadales bacterium]|nr:AsmA family protein [Desulfuromonadales bacterium]